VVPEDLAHFARSLQSLWALDLLSLLYRQRDRTWTVAALTRELRSTERFVRETVAMLEGRQVLTSGPDDGVAYHPGTPAIDDLVGRLIEFYRLRPSALSDAVYSLPNERLRLFSDAFKLRKD